jgi:nitrile hydratase
MTQSNSDAEITPAKLTDRCTDDAPGLAVSVNPIGTATASLTARRFADGQRVRVKAEWPEARQYMHIRTPSYIRGHLGVIVRCLGTFPNPEDLAFGRPARRMNLYHVAFNRIAVWPTEKTVPAASEATAQSDILLIELYEHWLEESELT